MYFAENKNYISGRIIYIYIYYINNIDCPYVFSVHYYILYACTMYMLLIDNFVYISVSYIHIYIYIYIYQYDIYLCTLYHQCVQNKPTQYTVGSKLLNCFGTFDLRKKCCSFFLLCANIEGDLILIYKLWLRNTNVRVYKDCSTQNTPETNLLNSYRG